LIVPFTQTSLAGLAAKLIQKPFAEAIGMAVMIDYLTGEGAKSAVLETIRSNPDSRTLLLMLPDVLAHWEFQGNKLLADLRPVVKLTRGISMAWAVRADSALQDWQGMAAASKGSVLTMALTRESIELEMVKKRTGISFTKQLTDGWPSSAIMALSGKSDLADFATTYALAHNDKAAAKDKLRLLATFGAERHPELPNVPTFAEIVGDRKAATTSSLALWSSATADKAFTDKVTAALLSIDDNEAMHAEARKLRLPISIKGPQVLLDTLARDRRVIRDVYG
jgi:tripartite-type tricarboxylate transporter receptor subunit TctC